MATKVLNKPVLEYFEELLTEVEKAGGQSYFMGLANIVNEEMALYEGRIAAVERELQNWPRVKPDPAATLRHVLAAFKAEVRAIEGFRTTLRKKHGV